MIKLRNNLRKLYLKLFRKVISDEKYIKIKYKIKFGYNIDLNNPQTFNEKLQWLKLNDRKKIYITMVDKYEVKKYISDTIGEEYVIKTIGVWDSFDDIDFSTLPNQFVLKCTHDSGGLCIVKDKNQMNIEKIKNKLTKSLNKEYYYFGREWPYKNVKPRIIAEEYIKKESMNDLNDYKFFCFNGKVKFFKIDFDRFIKHGANYYDVEKKLLPFGEVICPPNFDKKLTIPNNIDKMIALAEKLAKDIPFVRIDFYNVEGKIYFGEITFFPASGFGKFIPEEWDRKIGDMLDITSEVIKNEK